MARGISVEILKFQAVSEVSKLFIVSRASTKESKRTSLVPDWSQLCPILVSPEHPQDMFLDFERSQMFSKV